MQENCRSSRNSDDVEVKFGPIIKLDNRNKTAWKKLTMALCQKIVKSLLFFEFLVNLEQSESWIPDARFVKVLFSLIVFFYLTKTQNRTKSHNSRTIALSKGTIFAKKCWLFAKNVDISRIKRALVLKGIFSETTYV